MLCFLSKLKSLEINGACLNDGEKVALEAVAQKEAT